MLVRDGIALRAAFDVKKEESTVTILPSMKFFKHTEKGEGVKLAQFER